MSVRILVGDCLDVLKTMDAGSVHCCVTSPPYWGLRDYRVADQLGLEATPEEYVAKMVDVFREVRRVLRADGTLWLNIGDARRSGDALGLPWRVALALVADGWRLRQDLIWAKAVSVGVSYGFTAPESVGNRCTRSHEYVFMFSVGAQYYYDADCLREESETTPQRRLSREHPKDSHVECAYCAGSGEAYDPMCPPHDGVCPECGGSGRSQKRNRPTYRSDLEITPGATVNPKGRNRRSVWAIMPSMFRGAHVATMPEDLAEGMVDAGCPTGGTVLDPFGGAGTTGLVADRLNRDAILIELNPEYAKLAERRIYGDAPLFADVEVA